MGKGHQSSAYSPSDLILCGKTLYLGDKNIIVSVTLSVNSVSCSRKYQTGDISENPLIDNTLLRDTVALRFATEVKTRPLTPDSAANLGSWV